MCISKAPYFPCRHHGQPGVHHPDRKRASHHARARGTAVPQYHHRSSSLCTIQLCVSWLILSFLSLKEQICRSLTCLSFCWSSQITFLSVSGDDMLFSVTLIIMCSNYPDAELWSRLHMLTNSLYKSHETCPGHISKHAMFIFHPKINSFYEKPVCIHPFHKIYLISKCTILNIY